MPLLVVAEPQAVVPIVGGKVIHALAVLLVLKPFALVAFAVEEGIGAVALTLAFVVLAFIDVTVLVRGLTLSVGLSGHHFALILATVLRGGRAKRNLLRIRTQRQAEK